MRDRVRVLCRPAVAAGFRLAGLDAVEAGDPGEGARRLVRLLDEEELAVVLVEDDFHGSLSEAERRALGRLALPMVVPFPAPAWTRPAEGPEEFIAELLRQAIGYRVRLG